MVAHALNHKAMSSSIKDIFLRMVVTFPLLDFIKKAQGEGLKKENWKAKQMRGHISLSIRDN